MKPLGNQVEHYWLVQRMAKAVGTDLAAAYEDGRIGDADWAAMVGRCRNCQVTCACKDWLTEAELEGTQRDATVAGCENALVLPKI
ncbi:DUF6455 family protein [Pseudooceanicola sp. HF7]|uniref:DUF6455 family protein n=1 Tax=Pseudooceanicola sp. HF7 TaxID=2721560 RepID=UPI001431C45D|nr:DUF6455 family protein [Pseudooceanicola sp. HF7]NIZ11658.1 hypothetical protein [Pseudooceanicola sp. HF7]